MKRTNKSTAGDLREQIIAADDIVRKSVIVKEWGDTRLLVKTMTGLERAAFWKACSDSSGAVDSNKLFIFSIIFTVVNPDTGELVFAPGDFENLQKKNGAALNRLSRMALRLNGLDEESLKESEKN